MNKSGHEEMAYDLKIVSAILRKINVKLQVNYSLGSPITKNSARLIELTKSIASKLEFDSRAEGNSPTSESYIGTSFFESLEIHKKCGEISFER